MRLLGLLALTVAAAAMAGCSESSGEPDGPVVSQRVSRDFGQKLLSDDGRTSLEGHETMLRLLREHHDVKQGEGGGYIESIDGLKLDTKNFDSTWAAFVNGIETDPAPSEYKLYPGDRVQWDLRYWYVTLDVRAVVSAFPETFTRGFNGDPIRWRVLCEKPASEPCRDVKRVLQRAGVPLGPAPEKPQYAGRVLVGRWEHWRDRAWPSRIDEGAGRSGVFARFSPDGDELRLLDWKAHYRRSERGDVGLVAAMRPTEADFMWVVTGLNDAGVARAADALDPQRLRDAFALVVTPDGDQKIPLEPPR
jgi:hypothetical protein